MIVSCDLVSEDKKKELDALIKGLHTPKNLEKMFQDHDAPKAYIKEIYRNTHKKRFSRSDPVFGGYQR